MRNLATVLPLKSKIVHTLPSPSDKTLLRLWNKNFLTEIYRNTQTFAFKVLQECGSWVSRNGTVQMIFSKQKTETLNSTESSSSTISFL